jgi:hypothetical protein
MKLFLGTDEILMGVFKESMEEKKKRKDYQLDKNKKKSLTYISGKTSRSGVLYTRGEEKTNIPCI